jgi:hypothetical protein
LRILSSEIVSNERVRPMISGTTVVPSSEPPGRSRQPFIASTSAPPSRVPECRASACLAIWLSLIGYRPSARSGRPELRRGARSGYRAIESAIDRAIALIERSGGLRSIEAIGAPTPRRARGGLSTSKATSDGVLGGPGGEALGLVMPCPTLSHPGPRLAAWM